MYEDVINALHTLLQSLQQPSEIGAVGLLLRVRRLRGGEQFPKVTTVVRNTVKLPSP